MMGNPKKLNLTRFLVIATLLLACVWLELYFYIVHGITRAYPHLFYIPIVLAALWWGLKGGLLASLFLGLMHTLFYLPIISEVYLARSLTFVFIGFVVGIVSGKRKKAEKELQKSEEKLTNMLGSISDHMSMMDKDLNILWANETAKKIFGGDIIGRKCYEVYHGRKEPCEPHPCLTLKAFQDGKVHEHDTQVIDKNGKTVYFHCAANVALRDEKGDPTAVIEISKDLTEHKMAEKEVEKIRQQMEFILGATKTGLDVIDSEYNIRYVDPEWEKIYGEPAGRKCYEYFMGRSEACPNCGIEKAKKTKETVVTEEVLLKEDNRPIQVITIPFQNDEGEWLFAEVNVDITERKKIEKERKMLTEEIIRQTRIDGLTKVFNRQHLDKKLQNEVQRAQRYNCLLSVIMIDIDDFKEVNDTHGHQMGDKFLKMIAKGIRETIRTNDFVGRYGGEEFIVVCVETGIDEALNIAERIRRVIEEQQIIGKKSLQIKVTASFGVAQFKEPEDFDSLVTRVDTALYKAKNEGRNRVCVAEGN